MNATREHWRAVPGYEGMYEVSDQGRVKSLERLDAVGRPVRERVLRAWFSLGYEWVTFTLRGRQSKFAIHRLVMAAFVGPLPDGMHTRHLNGIKTDNRLENLKYGTPSENAYDRTAHGTNRNATKTHCIHGHEYTPENTALNSRGKGRLCRRCMYDRIHKYQRNKSLKSAELGMKVRAHTAAERWLAAPGYVGSYEVSDQGRVRSIDRTIVCKNGVVKPIKGRVLSPGVRGGYAQVNLARDAKDHKMHDIHWLVLAAFVGPRPEGQWVRHLNDNPIDNWLDNLEYGTPAQNAEDRIRNRLTA
jgi:hypothetical protein